MIELAGGELDAAVAQLEGWSICTPGVPTYEPLTMWERRADGNYELLGHLDFSRDWELGGPKAIKLRRAAVRRFKESRT